MRKFTLADWLPWAGIMIGMDHIWIDTGCKATLSYGYPYWLTFSFYTLYSSKHTIMFTNTIVSKKSNYWTLPKRTSAVHHERCHKKGVGRNCQLPTIKKPPPGSIWHRTNMTDYTYARIIAKTWITWRMQST